MELQFGENLRRYRRERDLTQEQLASEIGVSYQSVSKWERGEGYPDITLLPNIANFFGVTIDTLLGNDDAAQKEDIEKFFRLIREELPEDDMASRLRLGKEYIAKYPKNYDIAHEMCWIIRWSDKKDREEHMPLLRSLCEKIIEGCTTQTYREAAVEMMYTLGDEEDWEKWSKMCARDYKSYRGEILENRLLEKERYADCVLRKGANKLEFFCHLMTSNCGNWHDAEKSLAWIDYRIGLMKSFGENGELPPAWQRFYAVMLTYRADQLFRLGKNAEGYENLEKALGCMEAWSDIPDGTALDVGHDWMFHGICALKNEWNYRLADGTEEYSNYMYVFTDRRDYLATVMTMKQNWNGFIRVHEEERYGELLARAKKLAEIA